MFPLWTTAVFSVLDYKKIDDCPNLVFDIGRSYCGVWNWRNNNEISETREICREKLINQSTVQPKPMDCADVIEEYCQKVNEARLASRSGKSSGFFFF